MIESAGSAAINNPIPTTHTQALAECERTAFLVFSSAALCTWLRRQSGCCSAEMLYALAHLGARYNFLLCCIHPSFLQLGRKNIEN
jgi:hypothetical protein